MTVATLWYLAIAAVLAFALYRIWRPRRGWCIIALSHNGEVLILRWRRGRLDGKMCGAIIAYWHRRYGLPFPVIDHAIQQISALESGVSRGH